MPGAAQPFTLFAVFRVSSSHPEVFDGRDVGTVICPDADVKLFIEADSKARMERRARQFEAKGIEVVVYEPALAEASFFGSRVVRDLAAFKAEADLILANRQTEDLADVAQKVFTRDLFGAD